MRLTTIHRLAISFGAGIALLSLGQTASGQVVNGSFEDGGGSFSGWTTAGVALIQTAALGSGPTHGSFDALLASATDGTAGVPAGNGATGSQLETFLGLASGSLQGLGNGTPLLGSAVLQSITLQAGDLLSFDWNFMTNQTYNDGTIQSLAPTLDNNDFAFVLLRPSGGSASISELADTFFGYVADPNAPGGFLTGFTITPSSNPFISETGFGTWSATATQSGQFDLGIGVVHASTGIDNGVNSGLLVDNVRVQAVPEPASLAALGIGLTAVCRRRRPSR